MPDTMPLAAALRHALKVNRWLIALALLEAGSALALSVAYGLPYSNRTFQSMVNLLTVLTPVYLLVLLIWTVAGLALAEPRARPIPRLLQGLRATLGDLPRMASGAVALFSVTFFFSGFTYIKSVIPDVVPFGWDMTLANLDRAIHGGVDAHRLLGPLFDTPLATTAVNAAYHFWFFLLYFFVFVACFTGANPAARQRFLISFPLVWGLGGSLAALVFSSAGPCYYQLVGLGDRFVPLMQKLQTFAETSPVWALDVQAALWVGYNQETAIRGISAFPSMHVASSTLMMLHAFTWRRWAGWLMLGFLGLILVGSVHLGWHYAVDGYAAIALTVAIWAVVGRLLEGRARAPEAASQPAAM
ncbi:phosphatase PAP2 family protein [Cereibacter johrii]|uniref:phosphatase PAP2 family protein n=1 Tax=Cereibacter johrii TaxID=445629 RepID=UPI000DCAF750|nr:phosphatase PAP2 family protein [Cereibacter johrii]RAZ86354.1 inositol phosphorylceramide synthase [Cereibacter johrii]